MGQPFLGEIRIFAGNFAPQGWAFCEGQILAIAENDALFALIGTTYGGDGQTTFALPDLRGRVPVHQGPAHPLGEAGGQESVALTPAQMPGHAHPLRAKATGGDRVSPAGNYWAGSSDVVQFAAPDAPAPMGAGAIGPAGGGGTHENRMPHLPVNFIIALAGIFPSQA